MSCTRCDSWCIFGKLMFLSGKSFLMTLTLVRTCIWHKIWHAISSVLDLLIDAWRTWRWVSVCILIWTQRDISASVQISWRNGQYLVGSKSCTSGRICCVQVKCQLLYKNFNIDSLEGYWNMSFHQQTQSFQYQASTACLERKVAWEFYRSHYWR